jgi:integrase
MAPEVTSISENRRQVSLTGTWRRRAPGTVESLVGTSLLSKRACQEIWRHLCPFPQPPRWPLDHPGVRDILVALAAEARLEDEFTSHVLRHTFGTILVRFGHDLVLVAEFMGQSSPRDHAWLYATEPG